MFGIRTQEQKISELKVRLRAEREMAGQQLQTLVPQTRRALLASTFIWSARKALPLLQPLVFGLARKGAGTVAGAYFAKALGVAALAVGAWRLFRSDRSD